MREYLLVLMTALGVTFWVTPWVRWFAVHAGAITPVRDRDVHVRPKPRLGGLAMFLGLLAAAVVASQLPYLSQVYQDAQLRGVLLAAGLVTLVGAADDKWDLDWSLKLGGQVAAALVLSLHGVMLVSLPIFGYTILPTPVMVILTVLVVVGTMNAVNFVDGLDGLAAGVVGIASAAFLVWSYELSHTYDPPNVFSTATFLCAALVGVTAGFLPHNFHPSRLFMGDCGSLLLGLLVGAASISLTGTIDPASVSGASQAAAVMLPVAVPVAVMAIPLVDMVLAIIRRTRAGLRPWDADARHLHHQLLRLGHSHRGAVLTLYLWVAVVAGGVLSFNYLVLELAAATLAGGILLAVLVTWAIPALMTRGPR
ncbi:UDP-GlcNAc:undecaprenyl-phosphate GlcNAc-1-phosphate transferase [Kytococcus aerolatus]|uniref:UDP-GlcNAc:undecaprenyl-phosphate GlcNAc-1-phosphate transferase n=1 Tax=Kytococcus aerolatus TaxID=592308 RepID=A0A212T677_9MICO|nr:MraY family glycosyltransferase [Kytococcus aerolatus]SNC61563.1 UDP-GlcNAc:undecaprenyl-phosphate GlcNAc-1-phosphate transferase [Kytococcus aerolatus]